MKKLFHEKFERYLVLDVWVDVFVGKKRLKEVNILSVNSIVQ